MRKVTFFVPHYEDHLRLKTLLTLASKNYNFPHNFIIYDSSPSAVGESSIKSWIPESEFVYRRIHSQAVSNTYPLVIRDFMLSPDSDNGCFILPHDEFLLIDYQEFNSLAPSIPFSCGNQLSFCPDTAKIAEYSRAPLSKVAIAYEHDVGLFNPQYHSTYFPACTLKAIGNLFKYFIDKWGPSETSFPGFVQFDLLRRLNIYYSKNSTYIQEKRSARKSQGSFTHPSKFISKKSEVEILELKKYLYMFWNSIEILPNTYQSSSLIRLLDSQKLSLTFLMTEMNSYKYLFEFVSTKKGLINLDRHDIFCAYHQLSKKISSDQIEYIFGKDSTCLTNPKVLESLRQMIDSYNINV